MAFLQVGFHSGTPGTCRIGGETEDERILKTTFTSFTVFAKGWPWGKLEFLLNVPYNIYLHEVEDKITFSTQCPLNI